ncbi:MAG: NAD(P)/FAD-dependent oxidoreductase [Chloroflexi bacterium]|nr:NAD(P)/FAD-dependent oxidoreductase [Chloroflexota bacterium]
MRLRTLAFTAASFALGLSVGALRREPNAPLMPSDTQGSDRRRVIILGGGWGGVYTALTLERELRSGEGVEVVLISRDNFFLFTPMLPEAVGSAVALTHIVNPIRRMLKRSRFVAGEVRHIDLHDKIVEVELASGSIHRFTFDHLVLALGGETNFFGMADVAQHALTVKSLADAIAVRNHIINVLEQADVEPAEQRRNLTTFVLAGGGLNGVEVMGSINDFVRAASRAYPHVPAAEIRTVLLEAAPRLMPEVDDSLAEFTRRELQTRGVEVWLRSRVAGATDSEVLLEDGRRITTSTFIWSAGVRPSRLLSELPLDRDRAGRVIVDATMRVPGQEHVWALGDCAHIPNRRQGHDAAYPTTAQHALREAYRLGRNIAAVLRDEPAKPFDYPLRIQLAIVGHRRGVASLLGLNISGFLPWWLWRTYYLVRLPQADRRLRVALDWTLDLIFPRDIVELPVVPRQDHRLSSTSQSNKLDRPL